MAKGFRVIITDKEYEFLKNLAKQDGLTVKEEVQNLLSLQIREEMELKEQKEEQETVDFCENQDGSVSLFL